MSFVIFVGDSEIVCENKGEVALALIGLYNPIMEIPHHIEEIFERRGNYQ